MKELENKLQYKFKENSLIERAFTHSSYINESGDEAGQSYERLEFLGDAVLELIISDILFKRFLEITEGDLTKMRANIVCEDSLYDIACQLNLGEYIKFSKGESKNGGKHRKSILADVVESLIAVIYIEESFEIAKKIVERLFAKKIDELANTDKIDDYKSQLQMLVQARKKITPVYKMLFSEGPEHDKTFESAVYINNKMIAKGIGKSKRLSEQDAAKKAYFELTNK